MNIKRNYRKILSVLLVLVMCMTLLPFNANASSDEWEEVMDTFTLEAVKQNIPDPGFAEAVFNAISYAIENDEYHIDKVNICDPDGYTALWPEPLTVEEILDSGVEENELVLALLENYVGPIFAQRKKITDITGFRLLKNTTSIDFQFNMIEDLSSFTGCVIAGSYNFNSNPIHMWPVTFPDTVRAATHSVATSFSITTAPLAYLFGEVVTPTLTYGVYYPDKNGNLVLNTDWYSKYWSTSTAYGDTVPDYPQTNGTSSITLPEFKYEGAATIEIGLTGLKKIEDLNNWQANTSNAIPYISGMDTDETDGTPGQGNSPSYRFGVQAQRYAKVSVVENTRVTGGFKFTKISAATGKPVPGAEYTLYTEDGEVCVDGSFTTDENGVIEQGGIAPGTYYLKETKAPAGYAVNEEPVKIVIADPGVTTTLTGGVVSFEHDATEPVVNAIWGTKPATTGVWDKQTATTTENATTLGADAILTNKGNVGYKKLTALSVEPESNADNYDIALTSIEVFMGGELYATYKSDAEALTGINNIVNGNNLTGDISIVYNNSFTEKTESYYDAGEQSDELLIYSLKVTKNNEDGSVLKEAGFKVYSDEACTALAEVYADSEMTNLISDVEDTVLRTDENGVLNFYGLKQGNYYVKEVYAPTGFGLKDAVKIAMNADGTVTVNDKFDKTPAPGTTEISITVTDTTLVLDLPSTGFGGAIPFIAGGILIILLAFVGIIILNKKMFPKDKHDA